MKKELNVLDRNGNKIVISIRQILGSYPVKYEIKTAYIPEVKKDKPPFAKRGRITIICNRVDKNSVLTKLENYLTSLFIKERIYDSKNTSTKD